VAASHGIAVVAQKGHLTAVLATAVLPYVFSEELPLQGRQEAAAMAVCRSANSVV